MSVKPNCVFLLKSNLCSNKEAPKPGHSRCCRQGKCEEYVNKPKAESK